MFNLLAIGDPIIDTHVQIDDSCAECRVFEKHDKHLCFDYGAKIPIQNSFQALGGNAPNVAVAAVKLGLTSALISTVGQDLHGQTAIEELAKFGVDTRFITFDAHSQTRYSIVLNYHQERTILSYSEKKKYLWPEEPPAADWVYYTGLSEGFETIQKKLPGYLKKNKKTRLAVNPGSYALKYALPALRAIAGRADVLIVNREEALTITGAPASASEWTLLERMLKLGAKEAVLTDGERGAWAASPDEMLSIQSFPVVVIAKTGAGDAFSSAYLAAHFYGRGLADALLWGTANSAGVIGEHGPHAGLLDQKGIKKMVKRFSTITPSRLN